MFLLKVLDFVGGTTKLLTPKFPIDCDGSFLTIRLLLRKGCWRNPWLNCCGKLFWKGCGFWKNWNGWLGLKLSIGKLRPCWKFCCGNCAVVMKLLLLGWKFGWKFCLGICWYGLGLNWTLPNWGCFTIGWLGIKFGCWLNVSKVGWLRGTLGMKLGWILFWKFVWGVNVGTLVGKTGCCDRRTGVNVAWFRGWLVGKFGWFRGTLGWLRGRLGCPENCDEYWMLRLFWNSTGGRLSKFTRGKLGVNGWVCCKEMSWGRGAVLYWARLDSVWVNSRRFFSNCFNFSKRFSSCIFSYSCFLYFSSSASRTNCSWSCCFFSSRFWFPNWRLAKSLLYLGSRLNFCRYCSRLAVCKPVKREIQFSLRFFLRATAPMTPRRY